MTTNLPTSTGGSFLKEEVGTTLLWERPRSTKSKICGWWSRIGTHAITAFVTALVFWIVTRGSSETLPAPPRKKWLTCGNSTEDAKALGCEFDPLTVAWIPKPCFDREVSQEFMADYPWRAYSDKTSSEIIDKSQMGEYTAPKYYYTSAREHAVHCLFAMEKLHKAYQRHGNGLYLDSESTKLMHTKHCLGVVKKAIDRDPLTLEKLETRNTVALTTCEVDA